MHKEHSKGLRVACCLIFVKVPEQWADHVEQYRVYKVEGANEERQYFRESYEVTRLSFLLGLVIQRQAIELDEEADENDQDG